MCHTQIFSILGGFFVNKVGWQSNHFCKTDNKAKWYEKSQIFNPWQVRKRLFWKVVIQRLLGNLPIGSLFGVIHRCAKCNEYKTVFTDGLSFNSTFIWSMLVHTGQAVHTTLQETNLPTKLFVCGLQTRKLSQAPIHLGRCYHLTLFNRWFDCVGYTFFS